MAQQGSKSAYSSKQIRQARHIEDSEKKAGRSSKTAARIAYATVNKRDGGGKKSGSGRAKHRTRKAAMTASGKTSSRNSRSTRTRNASRTTSPKSRKSR